MAAVPLEHIEGKYEILDKLGEGGMGAIYKVRHRLLDEIRVVKVMRPALRGDEELSARFLREAKVAIQLRHPNIAQLFDFTVDAVGNAYIVMEYIEGLTFEEMLEQKGPPPLGLTLETCVQSLRALDYLHRKNFVHRDISPDNLMLTRDVYNRPLVKLIDLGIAKVLEGESGSMTATGLFLGKVRYSSPEQLEGSGKGKLDGRSDLYSFSIVLYEMLTGICPIKGETPSAWIGAHLFKPTTPFEETDPEGRVPAALRAITLHGMAKDREERILSAEDFANQLAALQDTNPLDDEILEHCKHLIEATRKSSEGEHQPGTTQDHLDHHFGPEPTPAPTASSHQDPTVAWQADDPTAAAPSLPNVNQVQALISGARKLAELGHLEEARQQLAAVRAMGPGESTLVQQLEETENDIEAAIAEKRQREAIAAAVSDIETALENDDLEGADRRLRDALTSLGDDEALATLARRLDERLRQVRAEQAAAHFAAAEDHGREERYDDALAELVMVLELAPNHRQAQSLRQELTAKREAREEARRRDEALDAIEALLLAADLDEAAAQLAAAEEAFGSDERLAALHAQHEELVRQAEVEGLLDRAQALAQRGELEAALELLHQAEKLEPNNMAVHSLLTETQNEQQRQAAIAAIEALLDDDKLDAAQRQVEAATQRFPHDEPLSRLRQRVERARALASAVAEIEEALTAQRLDDAAARLDAAEQELGDAAPLPELRTHLAAAQEEARAAAIAAQVAAHLATAQARLEADDPAAAAEAQRAALELDPQHAEAKALGKKIDQATERLEKAQRRQAAIAEAAAELGAALEAAGDDKALDDVEKKLGRAQRRWDGDEAFAPLVARLASRREEVRQAEVDGLCAEARQLRDDEKFDQAIRVLQKARRIAADKGAIDQLIEEVRTTQQEVRREKEKAENIRKSTEEIEARLDDGEPAEAYRKLEVAVVKFGDLPALAALRGRIEEALQEESGAGGTADATAMLPTIDADRAPATVISPSPVKPPPEAPAEEKAAAPTTVITPAPAKTPAKEKDKEKAAAPATVVMPAPVEAKPPAPAPAAKSKAPTPTAKPAAEKPPPQKPPAARPPAKPAAKPKPKPAARQPTPPPAPRPAPPKPARAAGGPLSTPSKGKPTQSRLALVAAGVLVLVVIAAVVFWPRGPETQVPPTTTGTLVLHAVPWGEVVEIRDAKGEIQTLPTDPYTPLALALPPGRYTIRLRHESAPELLSLEAEVKTGQVTRELARSTDEVSTDAFLESLGL